MLEVAFLGRLTWRVPLAGVGWVIVEVEEVPPEEGGTTIVVRNRSGTAEWRA